jgi:hypothetical protein
VIAAVLCAGCVGWSFVSHRLVGHLGTATPTTTVPATTPTTR